jgi:hypothetical protein
LRQVMLLSELCKPPLSPTLARQFTFPSYPSLSARTANFKNFPNPRFISAQIVSTPLGDTN